jgi:hypothetical protein
LERIQKPVWLQALSIYSNVVCAREGGEQAAKAKGLSSVPQKLSLISVIVLIVL